MLVINVMFQAVISDIASVMSDQEPPQKMTGTIDSSIKVA